MDPRKFLELLDNLSQAHLELFTIIVQLLTAETRSSLLCSCRRLRDAVARSVTRVSLVHVQSTPDQDLGIVFPAASELSIRSSISCEQMLQAVQATCPKLLENVQVVSIHWSPPAPGTHMAVAPAIHQFVSRCSRLRSLELCFEDDANPFTLVFTRPAHHHTPPCPSPHLLLAHHPPGPTTTPACFLDPQAWPTLPALSTLSARWSADTLPHVLATTSLRSLTLTSNNTINLTRPASSSLSGAHCPTLTHLTNLAHLTHLCTLPIALDGTFASNTIYEAAAHLVQLRSVDIKWPTLTTSQLLLWMSEEHGTPHSLPHTWSRLTRLTSLAHLVDWQHNSRLPGAFYPLELSSLTALSPTLEVLSCQATGHLGGLSHLSRLSRLAIHGDEIAAAAGPPGVMCQALRCLHLGSNSGWGSLLGWLSRLVGLTTLTLQDGYYQRIVPIPEPEMHRLSCLIDLQILKLWHPYLTTGFFRALALMPLLSRLELNNPLLARDPPQAPPASLKPTHTLLPSIRVASILHARRATLACMMTSLRFPPYAHILLRSISGVGDVWVPFGAVSARWLAAPQILRVSVFYAAADGDLPGEGRLPLEDAESITLCLGAGVTPAGLENVLANAPRLQRLDLRQARVVEALYAPVRALREWRQLQLTPAHVGVIAQHCRGVRRLDLGGCGGVTDAAVAALVGACGGALTHLGLLGATAITDESLLEVATGCVGLESVVVTGAWMVSKWGVLALLTARSLRHVRLHGMPLEAEFLQQLQAWLGNAGGQDPVEIWYSDAAVPDWNAV